jgi:hypothetical protein
MIAIPLGHVRGELGFGEFPHDGAERFMLGGQLEHGGTPSISVACGSRWELRGGERREIFHDATPLLNLLKLTLT